MIAALTEAAPAKVNLFLHVLRQRTDGYHELDSLAVFPAIGDELRAEAADELTLSVEGPFAPALSDTAGNLVLRAGRALAEAACVRTAWVRGGASLTLRKNLPVASGIGGGSADAAAALRLLSRLWGLELEEFAPEGLAAKMGADVPVCLASRPARMGGVGETLGPALVAGMQDRAGQSRRARGDRGRVSRPPGPIFASGPLPGRVARRRRDGADLAGLSNDLEAPGRDLSGYRGDARRSGPRPDACWRGKRLGRDMFGLFANSARAAAAQAWIARPGWWSWSGPLQSQKLPSSVHPGGVSA